MVALAVALGLSGLVFAVLTRRVVRGDTFGWDASLFRLLDETSTRVPLDGATEVLLALGGEYWDPPPVILVGAALCALLAFGRRRAAVLVAVTVAGAVVVTNALQPQFARAPLRADLVDLFPSGHATGSLAVVGALVVGLWSTRLRWPVTAFGLLFVVAYGVALVYLRRHYASDVLAGWCLAVMIVAAFEAVILAHRAK